MTTLTTLISNDLEKILIIIAGPTGVGKTRVSIDLAHRLGTEIISADARQMYRELQIGTATPTPDDLKSIKHHFIGNISIHDYYNVSRYEQEGLEVLDKLFKKHSHVILTGGSGLYIDAICGGLDDLPGSEPPIRKQVDAVYHLEGINGLRRWLKQIDPEFYAQVDLANPNRIKRAIEVFLQTGHKFSALRTNTLKLRPFKIKKIILDRPREVLFDRINQRVDKMVEEGLIEEALNFFRFRQLNALKTVGYKELFAWLSGNYSLQDAIIRIKTNSRRYAKRQITWFRRDSQACWIDADDIRAILDYVFNEE